MICRAHLAHGRWEGSSARGPALNLRIRPPTPGSSPQCPTCHSPRGALTGEMLDGGGCLNEERRTLSPRKDRPAGSAVDRALGHRLNGGDPPARAQFPCLEKESGWIPRRFPLLAQHELGIPVVSGRLSRVRRRHGRQILAGQRPAVVQRSAGRETCEHLFRWKSSQEQEAANRKEAMSLLDGCGLAEKANDPAEDLSYGQQKLLSLVCCLAAKADLLLLDEPVAGIAPEMIEKMLGIIRDLPNKGKSVMLIEHDLDAVMQVCDRAVFMDAGAKVSEGTPEEVRNDPKVIKAYID